MLVDAIFFSSWCAWITVMYSLLFCSFLARHIKLGGRAAGLQLMGFHDRVVSSNSLISLLLNQRIISTERLILAS
jgi:hypothetical protein